MLGLRKILSPNIGVAAPSQESIILSKFKGRIILDDGYVENFNCLRSDLAILYN